MKGLTLLGLMTFLTSVTAYAEEGMSAVTGGNGYAALAAGIAIGIAALGGAIGQGKIGTSAMEGIARNPQASTKMFVPMILALAFVETLVIFSFVIAFMLVNK